MSELDDNTPSGIGPPGPAGQRGEEGSRGPIGEEGPPGEDGRDGSDGEQGEKGEQGPAGPAGPAGTKGDPGSAGEAGPKGDKGDRGDAGAAGAAGKDGAKGDRGESAPANSGSDAELRRALLELEQINIKLADIWPPRTGASDVTGVNFELVTLTSDGGSTGDESTPCDWTYAFTASDGGHAGISPVTNRLPVALEAKRGLWDLTALELSALDEWPDGGPCA